MNQFFEIERDQNEEERHERVFRLVNGKAVEVEEVPDDDVYMDDDD